MHEALTRARGHRGREVPRMPMTKSGLRRGPHFLIFADRESLDCSLESERTCTGERDADRFRYDGLDTGERERRRAACLNVALMRFTQPNTPPATMQKAECGMAMA